MELLVATTVLVHVLSAVGIGAHAEVTGRRQYRWAAIGLLGGVLGILWYAISKPPSDQVAKSPLSVADAPTEVLEERPRERRLDDPNTLHLDLEDGTTLTGPELDAVNEVLDRLDADEPQPTEIVIEAAFEAEDAGYADADVWWSDCVLPALESLPEVDPPEDADDHGIDLELREVYGEKAGTTIEATDGTRTGRFEIVDGEVRTADTDVYAETSPDWVEFVKDRIADGWEERDWSPDGDGREVELESSRW